ncbi:hypothetical protein [Gluconobacter cerinus]|uniref:Porin n=1 Tax=Gluconobacter cerinus TaxID=38307 RepID=A0AAV5NEP0_9PROT|nr:hypothetical protein GCM10007867_10830 [Gluconobacter cerinus]
MSRFPLRMACSTVFSIRGLLMMSTAFGLLAVHSQAHADDDVMSRMQKEMHRLQEAQAHVQQEQEEINRDLVMLRSEMAKHHHTAQPADKTTTNTTMVARGTPSRSAIHGVAPHAPQLHSSQHPTELASEATFASNANSPEGHASRALPSSDSRDRVARDRRDHGVTESGAGSELAVVGKRTEDVMVRFAENGVGPHPRETIGAQAAGAVGDHGVFHLGPVTLMLGGFVDMAAVLENRHVASGTFNYWQDMPYPNEPRYHTNNFEGSARYSRLSLLARGNINSEATISGFFESDFGAGAVTTDPYESNSYAFRMRQAYLAYDDNKAGWHFLGGQAWSLLTPGRIGIVARQESLPETIEASMLAGQTWARQWQVRVVKDFMDHRLWAGFSIENPATLYDTTGFANTNGTVSLPNGNTATIGENGVGLTNDTANFSNEIAPDLIGKLAYDPSWGHYEVEGILHFPHDRVTINHTGHNNTAIAGGAGGSLILPIISGKLEFRAAGLAGWGINRYGSVLLPDATLNAKGDPEPLFGLQAQAGLIAHPNPHIDVYGYFGTQRVGHAYFNSEGSSYGYGNPLYSNAGCLQELSSLTCSANTRGVSEATIGAWWRFFKGRFGTVEGGTQLAYARRDIWKGIGGDPHTSMSQIFFDFRYLPFQ